MIGAIYRAACKRFDFGDRQRAARKSPAQQRTRASSLPVPVRATSI